VSLVCFDSTNHVYSDGDGTVYPSVTELLVRSKIVNFDAVREDIRQRSMKRGKSVHWITQLHDEGALDHRTVPKSLRGYRKAWVSYRKNTGFLPLIIERPFISPYGYAGTPDRFGSYPNSTWAVLDIKTGEGSVADWVRIQLAPYAKWYSMTEGIAMTYVRRIGVQLHTDGTYSAKEFPASSQLRDFAVFCQALCDWKENNGDRNMPELRNSIQNSSVSGGKSEVL
jgi:hypothetical protein